VHTGAVSTERLDRLDITAQSGDIGGKGASYEAEKKNGLHLEKAISSGLTGM
jgi:hypothetical protein